MTTQQLAGHYINASHSANREKNFEQAKQYGDLAIRLAPGVPEAWFNLGLACAGLDDRPAACAALNRAKQLSSRSADALNSIGLQFLALNELASAEDCFLRARELAPTFVGPIANLAILRHRQGRTDEETALLKAALTLAPDLPALHLNLGLALQSQRQLEAAKESICKALELAPSAAHAWASLGSIHVEEKNWGAAIECLSKCHAISPDTELVLGSLVRVKMSLCEWGDLDTLIDKLRQQIERGRLAAYPHEALSVINDPALLRSVTSLYSQRLFHGMPPTHTARHVGAKQKIRVGYFSSDLRTHPVGQLIMELIELHDRSRFEVIAFSLTRMQDDLVQQRARQAFDQFLDVETLDPHALAELARSMDLDIAVDLNGHTSGAKTNSFAMRLAPIQASYLGFAGTMGATYYDYLIADKTVCPPEHSAYYTEKLAYLPCGFMPHDSQRKISDRAFARSEFGLPQDGTIFCCFNNHYKITPAVFTSWMNILKRVERGVLWLSDGSQQVRDNLMFEAQKQGIDPQRIVFANRMDDSSEHLARIALADLFLDTSPYNAHATAIDALWAGLPLITCQGNTFASRVASSLLVHLDMSELITTTLEQYEDLAVELVTSPERLQTVRNRLQYKRIHTSLFSTQQRVEAMEKLFMVMQERRLAGAKPEVIDLTEN